MEKRLYNFFYKTKGAVAVFMVIILVPLVTTCCLFVDASRIKLARSVIQSSSDTALSTVLSGFDADLAEIYGMMASAQNNKEAINAAKEYFKKSMVSQGLDSAYADRFSNTLAGLMNGDDFSTVDDLLKISLDEGAEVKIEPATNGNLTNYTLLRSEIVEFMKYRGPIEGVTELFDTFINIKNDLNDSKEVSKLTEKENDYYEKQKALMEYLEDAYKDILNYNDCNFESVAKTGVNWDSAITKEKSTSLRDSMKKGSQNSKDYKNYNEFYVKDLCYYDANQSKLSVYSPPTIKIAGKTNAPVKKYGANNLKQGLESLQSKIETFGVRKAYVTNAANILNKQGSYKPGAWMRSQVYWKTDKESQFLSVYNGSNTGSIAYKYDLLAKAQVPPADLEATEILPVPKLKKSSNGLGDKENQTYGDCLKSYRDFLLGTNGIYPRGSVYSEYNTYVSGLKSVSKKYVEQFTGEKNDINAGTKRIGNYLAKAESGLDSTQNYLESAMSNLKKAKSAFEELETAKTEWKTQYDNADIKNANTKNEMKKHYDEAVKQLQDLNIKKESITKFRDRVSNTKSMLKTLENAIGSYKYGSKKISSILKYDTFKSAAGINASNIPEAETELNNYVNTTFNNKMSYPDVSKIGITNKNQPNFNASDNVTADVALYKWMQKKFVDKNGRKIDPRNPSDDRKKNEDKFNAEDENEDGKTDKVNLDGSDCSTTQLSKIPNKPSGGAATDSGIDPKSKDKKNNISNMSSGVSSLFKDMGDSLANLRDDMYVLLYITNMFSYDTFTKEKNYEKSKNNGQEGRFARCTLTNVEINTANNYSFGNEIEYIIYGKSNESNKKASYGTIYAIRYALDLVYALTHFWSGTNATAVAIETTASGIAAATCGVIPEPLTKIIMILALTALEANSDIDILKTGYPLAVVKSPDVWRYSLDLSVNSGDSSKPTASVGKSLKNMQSANEQQDIKLQYSGYLKLILLMKLLTNDKPIIMRTADVIQANMQKQGSKNFLMSKAVVYYKLEVNCRSSILMLTLPVVNQTMSEVNGKKTEIKPFNKFTVTTYRGY